MIRSLVFFALFVSLSEQQLGPRLLPEMQSHVSELFKEKDSGYYAKDGATNR